MKEAIFFFYGVSILQRTAVFNLTAHTHTHTHTHTYIHNTHIHTHIEPQSIKIN